jgi:hypothetical protein
MSDYFSRAATRADPVPAVPRPGPVSGPLDQPAGEVEEVEAPAASSPEGQPLAPRSGPVAPLAPDPWPGRPVVDEPAREASVEPPLATPAFAPPSARDAGEGRDRTEHEPAPPAVTVFEPRPVDMPQTDRPVATETERLVPPLSEPVTVVVQPEPARTDEVAVRPTEVPAAPPPGDPLALADAVMWGPVEQPAAVVPPPETRASDVPAAEPAPGPTIVIDRLTVELVDDRPVPAADPAPRPRPRPAGRLAAGRRFGSEWGW